MLYLVQHIQDNNLILFSWWQEYSKGEVDTDALFIEMYSETIVDVSVIVYRCRNICDAVRTYKPSNWGLYPMPRYSILRKRKNHVVIGEMRPFANGRGSESAHEGKLEVRKRSVPPHKMLTKRRP